MAALTAVVLIGGALALGMVHLILGLAVDRQSMSVAGLSPTAMSVTTWTAGGLLAAFLLACGAVLARVCVTDRPPGRLVRVLLVAAAVLHAVLASVVVGLVGWAAFVALITVFCLVMLVLALYPPADAAGPPPAAAGPAAGPAGAPATAPPGPGAAPGAVP
ncbi:hypothetical protein ACTWP5_16465 [Streptomyces sp. 4N509B]|uniref:hypothetical protein n=1 Tax=Streptomyces sp. 4N509B TaxID=3457413 RepID=UPI003FCF142C